MRSSVHGHYRQKRCAGASPPASAAVSSSTVAPDETIDVVRIPLEQRLAIADDYAAAHPGKPISSFLLELFPDLLGVRRLTD